VVATIIISGIVLSVRPAQSHIVPYSPGTLAFFLVCSIVFTVLGRWLVRAVVMNRHRAGKDLDRVLIAGNGDLARAVVERMNAHRDQLGFRIAGYLRNGDAGEIPGLPCLGGIADAERVLREHEIDHVFVALPHASSQQMMELLDRLVRNCLSIHVVPDLLQFMVLRSRVEDLDGLPTINLSETRLEGWSRFVKRGFDLGREPARGNGEPVPGHEARTHRPQDQRADRPQAGEHQPRDFVRMDALAPREIDALRQRAKREPACKRG
jgi:putative colanic acid biosynthesis UDP-glucose lipid carrier transferase